MPDTLLHNSYGMSRVRLVKVVRHAERHEVRDVTVSVALEGAFEAAHVAGDNAGVLPTDTMRNTVHVMAKLNDLDEPEGFARRLAQHFLKTAEAATAAIVEVEERTWERVPVAGWPHPTTFTRTAAETRAAVARAPRDGAISVESRLRGLPVMRTAGSAFSGFQRDRYTTLADTEDRLLAATLDAGWRHADSAAASFASVRTRVRQALLETFAEHESRSLQHTLYAMCEAALERAPEVAEIRLALPMRPHVLADLSPFGFENENEIFIPVDEPFGVVEATVRRTPQSQEHS